MSFRTQSLKSYRRMCQPQKKEGSNIYVNLFKNYLRDYVFWFYIIGSFLLAKSTLIDGLTPFGMALIIALKKENSRYLLPGIVGVFYGEFIRTSYIGLFSMIFMVVALFLMENLQQKLKIKDYSWWFAIGIIYLGIKLVPLFPGVGTYELYNVLFETSIVIVTGIIFCQAVSHIEEHKWPKSYSKEEVIPLALLFILIIFGMQDIFLGELKIQYIIAKILVLIFAYSGGGGIGAALGALLGTVLVLSNPNPVAIGALTLGGFLGGIFNDFKKPGTMLGFIIGAGIMTFYLSRPFEIVGSFQELAVSAIVFLLVPTKIITYFKKIFPFNMNDKKIEDRKYFSEILSKRTKELASIFNELSHTFTEASDLDTQNKEEIELFMGKVSNNLCQTCKKYEYCWEKNFFTIYRGIVETLSNLENKDNIITIQDRDLSSHLVKHCLKPSELKHQIKNIYEHFKLEVYWQRKIIESQEFVSSQLQGVGEIMNKISGELERELKNEEELEIKIVNELFERNIPVKSIESNKMGSGKLSVNVELSECKKKDLCVRDINHCVCEVLGEKMMVIKNSCFYREDESDCNFILTPFKAYKVNTGISQLTGGKENTCGDSCLSRQLKSGQHLLLLSDGMGKGKDAKSDSESAVKLLEKLLNSGFERNFVIKNVNRILSLRNQSESFATMDMILVDMLNGECEFYKAGAMPTYILRGNEIQKIEGQSLPAGIINNLEPTIDRAKLRDGDKVIMVSDGVFSPEDMDNGKDWLENELKNLRDSHPQVLADELAMKVKRRFYGDIKDDVTIMVSKVKKNFRTQD